jgi:magnesium chelatase subunit H
MSVLSDASLQHFTHFSVYIYFTVERIQRFGSNRDMWEEKSLTNTPEGVSPEKRLTTTKNKPITKEDDRLPPSSKLGSPGGDILQKKGNIGNATLLRSYTIGHPEDEQKKLEGFPSPSSKDVVEMMLKKFKQITKRPYPACVTFTIWGTDNIHTYGKTMAQVFELLGVKYKVDEDEFELVPLEELRRPRIDCVVACSGVFRDLFINQMTLMDRAIKMVAEAKEAPEMNLVRKHSFQLTQELSMTIREAASRVYSNAAGSYGANIAAWIKSNEWEGEIQLQRQFLARKCYVFNSDKPSVMEYKSDLFRAALRNCELTIQGIECDELISIIDVPHFYDADPTKLIQSLRFDNERPVCLLTKTTRKHGEDVLTISESIRLDAMSKILSPNYYEAILSHDSRGVKMISNCLRNILGWAVTSGEVDTMIFEIAYGIFMDDSTMQKRLREKDESSFRNLLATFLRAGETRYWDATRDKLEKLRALKKFTETLQ